MTGELAQADLDALHRLLALYWWMTDGPVPFEASRLFTDDAILELGPVKLDGLPAISAFFAERAKNNSKSGRITRHLAANFIATPDGLDRAEVRTLVVLYAGSGVPPIQATEPSAVADFVDGCVRTPVGWRFRSRRAETLFVGSNAPLPGMADKEMIRTRR